MRAAEDVSKGRDDSAKSNVDRTLSNKGGTNKARCASFAMAYLREGGGNWKEVSWKGEGLEEEKRVTGHRVTATNLNWSGEPLNHSDCPSPTSSFPNE